VAATAPDRPAALRPGALDLDGDRQRQIGRNSTIDVYGDERSKAGDDLARGGRAAGSCGPHRRGPGSTLKRRPGGD